MDQIPGLVEFLKNMPRPDTDEYFLLQALIVSTRATCSRRRVGCVLVDRFHKVIATGYNGVASGLAHCIDVPCPGAGQPSGQGLALCEALHAEENALIQCTRPNEIDTVYCTASPCVSCVRKLMNTGARRIVFAEVYPHAECERLWAGETHVTNSMGEPAVVTVGGVGPNGKRTWEHLPWTALLSIENTQPVKSEPGISW